jgi:hypothetical protein
VGEVLPTGSHYINHPFDPFTHSSLSSLLSDPTSSFGVAPAIKRKLHVPDAVVLLDFWF